jgi:hypothetical protein
MLNFNLKVIMKEFSKIIVLIILFLQVGCSKTDLYQYPSSESDATAITGFSLVNETAASVIDGSVTIDRAAGTVSLKAVTGTDLTKLYPRATVSEGVIVEPKMGYLTDFSRPVQYKLIAGDRQTSQIWTVTVTF